MHSLKSPDGSLGPDWPLELALEPAPQAHLQRDVPASGVHSPHQLILSPYPAGYEETLTRLAAILAKHFADTRIVGTGEALDRGLGGMRTGWHPRLAIFCRDCHPGGGKAWAPGSCQAPAEVWPVLADIRDSLMQALASYVCYPNSLRAVERIPEEQ